MSSELALKGKMFEKDMKNFLQRHTIYTENSAEERIELIEDIDILLDTFRKQVVNDDKNRRRTRGVKDALIQTAIQELQQNEDLKVAYSPQLLKEYLNPMLIESLLAPHFALKLQEELLPSIESVMTKSVANVIDFHEQERKRAVDKVKPSETPPLLNSLTGFEEAAKQLKDQGVDCELALSSQGERPLQQAM